MERSKNDVKENTQETDIEVPMRNGGWTNVGALEMYVNGFDILERKYEGVRSR